MIYLFVVLKLFEIAKEVMLLTLSCYSMDLVISAAVNLMITDEYCNLCLAIELGTIVFNSFETLKHTLLSRFL